MEIQHIFERTELVPVVARHLFEHWRELHEYEKESYSDISNDLKENRHYDLIPITLIAVENGEFLGTISIIKCDMVGREELTPWIADLYIVPKYRNRGVLFKLFEGIKKELTRLEISDIYIYTSHTGSYYKKLGFEVVENVNYANQQVIIMKKVMK